MNSPTTPTAPLQTPLTAIFPVKSPRASAQLLRLLPTLQGRLRQAVAALPQTHFFRCMLINEGSELAMMATYDGSTDEFLDGLLNRAGTILDQLLEFACPPAPLPVTMRRGEFKRYVLAVNAPAPFWYSATPQLSVSAIRDKSKAAGRDSGDPVTDPSQNTLCAILNVKSPADAVQLRGLMLARTPQVLQAFADVGTVHFARFLFLRNETQFAIITAFDGTFEKYSHDFVEKLGQIFDALLAHVVGGDASLIPVQQHFDAFHKIIVDSNYAPPTIWYSAYPRLSVQNKLFQ
jgi:hypothetical protein